MTLSGPLPSRQLQAVPHNTGRARACFTLGPLR